MSKNSNISEKDFFAEVRQLLEEARSKAYQSVNTIMVETYWQIGQRIVAQEDHGSHRATYGKQLIAQTLQAFILITLAKDFLKPILKI